MDNKRFEAALSQVVGSGRRHSGIGTLNEKTLHAVMKLYMEPHTENHEIPVGKYVADIIGENGIVEIQTGNFTKLRPKLEQLLEFADITLVHPMAAQKKIIKLDPLTGELSKPRRSPQKLRPIDSVFELVRIMYILDNPKFRLKLIMLEMEEYRILDNKPNWKRRRSHRCDRIPVRILDEIDFCVPSDYDRFIPEKLGKQFTIKEFAVCAGVPYQTAQCAVKILCYLERIRRTGKTGRENLYVRNGQEVK